MGAPSVEDILERLREQGGRSTTARRAIVEELVQTGGHVTADELASAVQAKHPDVHTSTIYRCLDALHEVDVIEHIHSAHGATVFHLVSHEHQHLVCDSCGGVQEIPATLFQAATAKIQADYGFRARPEHLAIPGLCLACQTGAVRSS